MKKMIVIYDDSKMPENQVQTITGHKSFGDTIFKRISLKNRMKAEILENKDVLSFVEYNGEDDVDKMKQEFSKYAGEIVVVHLFSNFALANSKSFKTLLEKACFMNENYVTYYDETPSMYFIVGTDFYLENRQAICQTRFQATKLSTDAFMDLSNLNEFLNFITGGFDARFFNALLGDSYTVTKKSTKKWKIKAEYEFYHLLPDEMKMWFVMPFHYTETENDASYTMERYHMTDIAIRFVHGAVDKEELKDILDKLFYFISTRSQKEVSVDMAKQIRMDLYVDKLKERMIELKGYKEYTEFNHMLAMGTKFSNIEEITDWYFRLYNKIAEKRSDNKLCVGHGDLCFSNILYNKDANILKLIDPKGATKEEDLYTDPYYDVAKLSHSICGSYDFFNTGLFQVTMDRNLQLQLTVDTDNQEVKEMFYEYLDKNGFNKALVRLYEASLFLSMLPYHMDQPGKVFGFIMNAIEILQEVEECIQD